MERLSSVTLRVRFLFKLLCSLALLGLCLFLSCRTLKTKNIGELVSSDIPTISLKVKLLSADPTPGSRRLGLYGQTDANAKLPKTAVDPRESNRGSSTTKTCVEIVGGDETDNVKPPAPAAHCPNTATWQVTARPVALSISFLDGSNVWDWLTQNSDANAFLESPVIKGALRDPRLAASIRAEDLGLTKKKHGGIQGAFVQELLKEALSSHAVLDYDLFHASTGFVFSFARSESDFASASLPLVLSRIARSAYQVVGLEEPIYEGRLGAQRLFVTEQRGRVYFANGLEALLNTLDQAPPSTASRNQLSHRENSLQLTIRGSAFLPGIMPLLVPKSTSPYTREPNATSSVTLADSEEVNIDAFFHLDQDITSLGQIVIGDSNLDTALSKKLFQGALGAIPQDIGGAVSASFYLPSEWTAQEWNAHLRPRFPNRPKYIVPESAGVSLLFDLSDQTTSSFATVGVVVATPQNLGQHSNLQSVLAHPELSASCAGGALFIAATSESLLQRMKESCEHQKPSVLDFNYGSQRSEVSSSQVFMLFNPGLLLGKIYDRGSANALNNRDANQNQPALEAAWKTAYFNALDQSAQSAHKSFSALPIWGFAGGRGAAPVADQPLVLDGFTIIAQ